MNNRLLIKAGTVAYFIPRPIKNQWLKSSFLKPGEVVESGPPPETKVSFGGGYGSSPKGSSINEWFIGQFEHSNFLYFPQENIYSISVSSIGGSAVLGLSREASDTGQPLPSRIVIVNPQNLQTIREWDVNTSTPYDLTYSPDGNVIVSGGNDSTIYFWNAQMGEMLGMPLYLLTLNRLNILQTESLLAQ